MTQQPQTPIHLITSSDSSSNQYQNLNQLKSPLNSNDDDDEDEFMTLGTPLNSYSEPILSNNHNNNDQGLEKMLKNMIVLLNDPKTNEHKLTPTSIKSILEKSLSTISHYKLQNNILKFENNESNKRFDVENGLIKTQVDYLLKSPFKPSIVSISTNSNSNSSRTRFKIHKSIPKSSNNNNNSNNNNSNKTKKLKLVEKNKGMNSNDNKKFNDYIKVFHLEK